MIYNKLPDIPFPWKYEDLQKLPIFMKDEIYRVMDEFIEEEKKMMNTLRNKGQ